MFLKLRGELRAAEGSAERRRIQGQLWLIVSSAMTRYLQRQAPRIGGTFLAKSPENSWDGELQGNRVNELPREQADQELVIPRGQLTA